MTAGLDRNGLEILSEAECRQLLARHALGRIGMVTADGSPLVLPVNFHLDDDRVLIRTTAGSKLDAASRGEVLCLEVDDFDVMYHSGWSVVVRGTSRAITDPGELDALDTVPLQRWARRGQPVFVEIALTELSGRRLNDVR